MADENDVIQEVVAPAPDVKPQGDKDYNFIQLRQKTEQLERDLDRERQEKVYYMQMQQQRQIDQNQTPQEPDFDYRSFETEDFVEGKKVAKALASLDRRLSEKDKKISVLEAAISNTGFNEVVTEENIKKYIMNDPDFVALVKGSSNPAQAMFKLISKNGDYIADKAQKERSSKPISQELKKIAEDSGRPKTSPVGVRSESIKHAAKFSELSRADKAALWAETQKLARRKG